MPKQQITSAKIRQPSGHFSHATMVAARGRIVFISGMTARRPDGTIAGIGDVEAQTRQVCENLKAAVEEAGGRTLRRASHRAVVVDGTPMKGVDFRDKGQHVTLRVTCPDSLLLCATIFSQEWPARAGRGYSQRNFT